MKTTLLADRAVALLKGEDAVDFLQGLISNDSKKITSGRWLYAAMLSPQGKFLHDFFLTLRDNSILLDCHAARLPDLVKRLTLYKLRARVDITLQPELAVAAAWGDHEENLSPDPRLMELGYRIIAEKPELENLTQHFTRVPFEDYEHLRLSLGVPDGAKDMIIDKSLLLEFHFEELHGVDFNKGCYVGQEVTARSKFRGQVRKSLFKVEALEGELPEKGTAVLRGEKPIGDMLSHQQNLGLALLRTEEIGTDSPIPIYRAGDKEIIITKPDWIKT